MGETTSKSEPQSSSTSPNQAEHLHNEFTRKAVDGKSAFERAFANDDVALKEITRIVSELEGGGANHYQDPARDLQAHEKAKFMKRKAQRVDAVSSKKAEIHADRWLQEQLQDGLCMEKAWKAEHPTNAKGVSVATQCGSLGRVEQITERRVAKTEQMARALLWERSASRTSNPTKYELGSSLRALAPPIPPVTPDVDASVPTPPTLKIEHVTHCEIVPELYHLLNVTVDATFDEIKKAYRKQALKWHPDRRENHNKTDVATERFKRITDAFDILYDPERRAKYDSGAVQLKAGRLKKLAGHGWSNLADDDDLALTPQGLKWKKQSWRGYVLMYGRLDDDPADIVQDANDPRAPEMKLKVFWRFLAEMAFLDREAGEDQWLKAFIGKVWKDMPSKWPNGLELKTMNDAAQQEWKERRMVFNRRKQKIRLHIELHEQYLAIPNREKKEVERLMKLNPVWVRSFGMDLAAGMERVGIDKLDRSSSHLRA